MIRILLVDDHVILLEGLRALLSDQTDIDVVGEACDGRKAIDLVRTLSPNVVVMDVGMPELNGIDATRRIRTEYPKVQVVALSTHSDGRYVQHMLEAGACGYVLKITAYDDLLRAVRSASLGRTYLSAEVAGGVVERSLHGGPGNLAKDRAELSTREREVLQLVAEGRTSAEAAKVMYISTKTVETHRRNIVLKLGLHGTAELTKYAIREGLTSTES